MKASAAAAALLLTACAGPQAASWSRPITPRIVERLESGRALHTDIMTVGVADSAAMNAASRVRVRNLICSTPERDRVTCTYHADRCLEGEEDGDGDRWCARAATFVRWLAPPDPLFSVDGWFLDRPSPQH